MANVQNIATVPEIITDAFLATLRAHGAVEAYVFGSMTLGDERPDSDLDLLVTFDPLISLMAQVGLIDELSALCGRRVDLLTRVHPVFVPYIEPTLVSLPI